MESTKPKNRRQEEVSVIRRMRVNKEIK